MPKKVRRQEARKKYDARCLLCPEDDPAVLDAHRLIPGAAGGKYTMSNLTTLCASCHRRWHAGRVDYLGRHLSTTGYKLHLLIDGVEHWLPETRRPKPDKED